MDITDVEDIESDENPEEEYSGDPEEKDAPLSGAELISVAEWLLFIGFVVMLVIQIAKPEQYTAGIISMLCLLGVIMVLMIKDKGNERD